MERKHLVAKFGVGLLASGFKKKASTWYRRLPGALQVVNLQKSSFGDQFYVNLACVPTGMESEDLPFPKEYQCPVRIRLGQAYPAQADRVGKVLDLENVELEDKAREDEITYLVSNLILPFLAHMSDADRLREAIESNVFGGGLINFRAREFLGLQFGQS